MQLPVVRNIAANRSRSQSPAQKRARDEEEVEEDDQDNVDGDALADKGVDDPMSCESERASSQIGRHLEQWMNRRESHEARCPDLVAPSRPSTQGVDEDGEETAEEDRVLTLFYASGILGVATYDEAKAELLIAQLPESQDWASLDKVLFQLSPSLIITCTRGDALFEKALQCPSDGQTYQVPPPLP